MKTNCQTKWRNRDVRIIIEHLEPALGEWIWLEYRHASKMIGKENLLFTNVKRRKEASKLSELGKVDSRSVTDLGRIYATRIIVLDPQSPEALVPRDINDNTSLVIGGILGDHPAKGRTKEAITMRMKSPRARNLGAHQFSVDGAVNVALRVAGGEEIHDIPVSVGVELITSRRHSNVLPFAYPLVAGKPLITPGLRQYLKRGIRQDEEFLFRTGKPRSII